MYNLRCHKNFLLHRKRHKSCHLQLSAINFDLNVILWTRFEEIIQKIFKSPAGDGKTIQWDPIGTTLYISVTRGMTFRCIHWRMVYFILNFVRFKKCDIGIHDGIRGIRKILLGNDYNVLNIISHLTGCTCQWIKMKWFNVFRRLKKYHGDVRSPIRINCHKFCDLVTRFRAKMYRNGNKLRNDLCVTATFLIILVIRHE